MIMDGAISPVFLNKLENGVRCPIAKLNMGTQVKGKTNKQTNKQTLSSSQRI